MRKVCPINPVQLSNLTSVDGGSNAAVILGAKVEEIHEYPIQFANNNIARRIRLVLQNAHATKEGGG